MSYINSNADLSEPYHRNAWHAEDGTLNATVRLGGGTLFFDSAQDARAVAAACLEAAEALDRLAAEEAR